jgi:large subunit ribosomal protein L29
MSTLDLKDLREKSADELTAELLRLRKEHFNLRMHKASGQLGQVHLLRDAKNDIGRVKTQIQEKRDG